MYDFQDVLNIADLTTTLDYALDAQYRGKTVTINKAIDVQGHEFRITYDSGVDDSPVLWRGEVLECYAVYNQQMMCQLIEQFLERER